MFLSLTISALIASAGPVIEPPATLVDAGFLAKVSAVNKDFAHTADYYRVSRPSKALERNRIPTRETDNALSWMRKILREPLAKRLEAGVWTAYPRDDHLYETLVCRASGSGLMWSDMLGTATLYLDLGLRTVLDDDAERERFVLDLLDRTFRLGPVASEGVLCGVVSHAGEDGPLWGGYVARRLTKRPDGKLTSPMGWDCSLLVITDGRHALIRVNLRDDYPTATGNPRARMPGDPIPPKSRFDK